MRLSYDRDDREKGGQRGHESYKVPGRPGGLEKFQVMQRCNREGSGPGHLKKGAVSPHFDFSPFIYDPGEIDLKN